MSFDHNDRIQKAQRIEQFSDLGKYDPFWYNVSFFIKFAEKLERILALIPLYAQNTWIRSIISGTWSRLLISNSSGQFEAHLLNSNAPNFNSWMVSSRINFNSLNVSAPVSMSSI